MMDMNIFIGTKAGNIWTVQIPVEKLQLFIQLKGIDYIQLDEPVFVALDSARHDTHVDSVHQGNNIPHAYTGKNVVVGIIDAGFDFTHPTMMDTTGTIYRVKEQPEKKLQGLLLQVTVMVTNYRIHWHCGLAVLILIFFAWYACNRNSSGLGVGSSTNNHRFRGCAFESDIVLVGIRPDTNEWTSTGLRSIIDGMAYIFNYATSVGKPASGQFKLGLQYRSSRRHFSFQSGGG